MHTLTSTTGCSHQFTPPRHTVTPPGYKTTGGSTTACGAGLYRAEWTTPSAASACTPCGVGILAEAVDQITSYDISTEAASSVSVAGSAGACCEYPLSLVYVLFLLLAYFTAACDHGWPCLNKSPI